MNNTLAQKSFELAVRIVRLCKYLREGKSEFTLTRQLLRCGTSVGANVRESMRAESRLDFIHKLSIARKEADETLYWIELLQATAYLSDKEYGSIQRDVEEILRLLTSIIKTSKKNPR